MTCWLMAKNLEIVTSINDMLAAIVSFPLNAHDQGFSE